MAFNYDRSTRGLKTVFNAGFFFYFINNVRLLVFLAHTKVNGLLPWLRFAILYHRLFFGLIVHSV